MLEENPWLIDAACWIIPFLTAISWREAIKTQVCYLRGDTISKLLGFGSFSLTKNLDPFGSALSPLLLIMRSKGFVYGWAKSIEIRPNFLNRGRFDVLLVILAALLTNFLLAILWAYIGYSTQLWQAFFPKIADLVLKISHYGIHINLLLILVHLLPLPPFDLSYLIRSYLPPILNLFYLNLDFFGQYIVFTLIFLKIAHPFLGAGIEVLESILFDLVGFQL